MVTSSQPMDTDFAGDASHQQRQQQDVPPPPRQRLSQTAPMTEDEQRERRASIREIMQDQSLTPLERRRSIQGLMDGRRRSSNAASSVGRGSAANNMSMMAAAAAAAADFYDSSDEDDDDDNIDDDDDGSLMDDDDNNNNNNNADNDNDLDNNSFINFGRRPSRRSSAGSSGSGGAATGGGNRSRRNSGTDNQSTNSNSNSGGFMSGRKKGRSASLRGFAAGAAAAAAAAAAAFSEDPEDVLATAQRMERSRPKCDHYQRNCTIISPCCGLAFGCRICHDECPVLPPPVLQQHEASVAAAAAASADAAASSSATTDGDHDMMNSNNNTGWKQMDAKPKMEKRNSLPSDFTEEETHHNIDRFAIKEVICRNCFTRQSSKTNQCIACKIQFGEYHCSICNLWMSQDEEPYHCEDCGFCRVGGRDNFRHCHDCGMCIDALLFDDHNCKAGKYMSNCPVCQEDLFSSRSASHEMPCGHAIHWHCFRELTSFDTRCPVCKKTAETHEQMAPTWSAMAMGIALQPVPPEMARVVSIVCNDCEVRDENRRWHFLGVQCNECGSFNTTVERTTLMGREAAVFLGDDVNGGSGATGGGDAGGGAGSPALGGAGGSAEMESSAAAAAAAAAAAVASVESNARSEALNNVMAAMEESASSLASLGIDDDMEDLRRSTIQAQLVHAIGGEEEGVHGGEDSMEEDEDVPQGQETSSGSSSSAY